MCRTGTRSERGKNNKIIVRTYIQRSQLITCRTEDRYNNNNNNKYGEKHTRRYVYDVCVCACVGKIQRIGRGCQRRIFYGSSFLTCTFYYYYTYTHIHIQSKMIRSTRRHQSPLYQSLSLTLSLSLTPSLSHPHLYLSRSNSPRTQ